MSAAGGPAPAPPRWPERAPPRWPACAVVVVLIAASLDVVLTRRATWWRGDEAALAAQTLLAWAIAAIPATLVAAVIGRIGAHRLGSAGASRLGRLALVLIGPVALHAVLRDPLRAPGGLSEARTWGVVALALLGTGTAAWLLALAERRLSGTARPVALLGLVLACAFALWPRGAAAAPAGPGVSPATAVPDPRAAPSATDEASPGATAAPAAGRPNLLLLVWDTTRADALSPYGAARATTPHLQRLAQQGTVFEHAFSPAVFTLTSHASMLTGLWPSLHGAYMHQQRLVDDTIAATLARAGYRTGAFVGTSVLRGGLGLERGFDVYDDRVDPRVCDTHLWALVHDVQAALASLSPAFAGNGLPHWFQDFQRPAREVLDAALAFVRRDDPRPWFVMVNLFDAHWPHLPGEAARAAFVRPYDGPLDGYLFRSDDFPAGHAPDADDKRFVRDVYEAEMWELDAAVDAFLGALALDEGRTAVLMTADHGEGLGEKDTWSHGDLLAPQTRVPFIVLAPGRAPAGARRDDPVSGVDVAPTLLGLAGLPPLALDGTPLPGLDVLATRRGDGERPHDAIFVEDRDNFDRDKDHDAILEGRFKLVVHVDGRRTLHDWRADPLDEVDLAPDHPELVERLSARLAVLLASRQAASGTLGNVEALRALGYLGGDVPPEPAPEPASDG